MEITGKVIAVLPLKSGVSASTGNAWSTQDYVIETAGTYPTKCCFNVFGEDKIKAMDIKVGEELTVSFDIDAREYQGRWFNSIRAWKVKRGSQDDTGTEPQSQESSEPITSAGDAPF
jgi:hypothetical protein